MNNISSYEQFGINDMGMLINESQSKLVVLVFTADWLGSGHILEEFIQELSNNMHGFKTYLIDAEKSEDLGSQLSVNQLPTTLFLKEGEVVDYFSGLIPKRKIKHRIEQIL